MRPKGKHAGFTPFWIMLGILGILLIGSFITPFKIVLDDTFDRFESNAVDNGDSKLSCTNPEAYWYIKSTCFTLGGFMTLFVLYILYSWIGGMVNGAKARGPVFAPRLKQMQQALEE